jgi:Formamidopyrimidine-DNA glycosylase N-terminal domain
VPEGDTIRSAANRIGAALIGRDIESIETPHPRHAKDAWPDRLAGRRVRAVDVHGKHLMMRFEGGLTLHSHLRMTGAWGVYRRGKRWHRGAYRAWLVIRTADHDVVQFDGPVLELMTDGRSRFDQRLAQLGPDVLADEFDNARFLRRLHEDDAHRRRCAARPAERRRDRQHLEVGGLLRRGHRSVAAPARPERRRSVGDHRWRPAADARVGRSGLPEGPPGVSPPRHSVPALPDDDPGARPRR